MTLNERILLEKLIQKADNSELKKIIDFTTRELELSETAIAEGFEIKK